MLNDMRKRGTEDVGVNRLIVGSLRPKAAMMDHSRSLATHQNVVRVLLGV